jgi:hypothetical protein
LHIDLKTVGRADEAVAKEIGLSRSKFQRGEAILIQYPEVFENDIKKAGMKIGSSWTSTAKYRKALTCMKMNIAKFHEG